MDTAIFTNPITGHVEQMPIEMIGAYVPHAEYLHLEEAAKVTAVRDEEAAANLIPFDTEYLVVSPLDVDRLAVQPPSLR